MDACIKGKEELNMKATLEFEWPHESESFKRATKAIENCDALEEVERWLRGLEKHTDQETVTIAEVREKIREALR
jgi:hypothetical protein